MAAVFTWALLTAGAAFPASPAGAPPVSSAGHDGPVRVLEIDLTPPGALLRLGGLELDLMELRPGYRALALEWPQTRERLDASGLPYTVREEDLGAARVRRAFAGGAAPAGSGSTGAVPPFGSGSMAGYWTLEEVTALLDSLAASDSTGLLTAVDTLGFSVQGRPILALGVVHESAPEGTRPEVLFTALTHAREPQGMQAVLHFLLELLDGHGEDPSLTYLVENREIWFVPVVNPDGYLRNQNTYDTTEAFGYWRKNLRDNDGDGEVGSGDGVDLNRNFGYAWGHDDTGSSPNPQSQVYRGPGPFSEPETAALRDFCAAHAFRTADNYHSFHEAVLYPWGHVPVPTPDSTVYERIADARTRGNGYAYGFGDQILYPVNGDADDWMYGEQTAKPRILSMTTEVGGQDDGWWPPVSRIEPLARENLHANLVLAYAAGVYLRARDPVIDAPGGFLRPGHIAPLGFTVAHDGAAGTPSGGITATVATDEPGLAVLDGTAFFPDLTPGVAAASGDGVLLAVAPELPPGTPVKLFITLTDGAGYHGRDSLEIRVGEPVVVFRDDAEDGLVNWIDSGGFGTESDDGGNTWFTDSPGGDYPNDHESSLTLIPAVDLSGGTSAFLGFTARWNIESGYDFGVVEASPDSGARWIPLHGRSTVAGEDPAGAYAGSVQLTGEPGYEANRRLGVREEVDLTPFAGLDDVRLRFRVLSDSGVRMDGWWIDDVAVRVYAPVTVGVEGPPDLASRELALTASPNPVRSGARISYALDRTSAVTVGIYDVAGRLVRALSSGLAGPGEKVVHWNRRTTGGRAVPAGTYYVRVVTPHETAVSKLTVLR